MHRFRTGKIRCLQGPASKLPLHYGAAGMTERIKSTELVNLLISTDSLLQIGIDPSGRAGLIPVSDERIENLGVSYQGRNAMQMTEAHP